MIISLGKKEDYNDKKIIVINIYLLILYKKKNYQNIIITRFNDTSCILYFCTTIFKDYYPIYILITQKLVRILYKIHQHFQKKKKSSD